MKLLSKEGEQLVDIALMGVRKESLKARVCVGDIVIESPEIKPEMKREGDCLKMHMHVPGVVNCSLLLEPDDIKALKDLMSKDVIKFMMKSFF